MLRKLEMNERQVLGTGKQVWNDRIWVKKTRKAEQYLTPGGVIF